MASETIPHSLEPYMKDLKDRQQVITAVLPWAQLNTLYEILPYPSYF